LICDLREEAKKDLWRQTKFDDAFDAYVKLEPYGDSEPVLAAMRGAWDKLEAENRVRAGRLLHSQREGLDVHHPKETIGRPLGRLGRKTDSGLLRTDKLLLHD